MSCLTTLREAMPQAVRWYDAWFPGLPPGLTPRGSPPGRGLYSFQLEALLRRERAVTLSYFGLPGPSMLLELWARQIGKNHTDALFSHRMMTQFGSLQLARKQPMCYAVVSAPTWDQIDQSKRRIEQILELLEDWDIKLCKREGSMYWLEGLRAALLFKSVGAKVNAKGETADLYQVVNECQNTSKPVYDDSLAPMRASTGAPVIFQGTQGPEECLSNVMLELAREEEQRTGERLVHIVTGPQAAEQNPRYGEHLDRERHRLGEDHDVYRENYLMMPSSRRGRFCSEVQLRNLHGDHPRLSGPRPGKVYVGGVDFTGAEETEDADDLWSKDRTQKRDSTFAVVAELEWIEDAAGLIPVVLIVDWLWLPGMYPDATVQQVYEFLFARWRVQHATLDARGVGEGPAYTIQKRRPSQVECLKATAEDNTRIGYRLLAAANGARMRVFRQDGVSTPAREWNEFWLQWSQLRRERKASLVPGHPPQLRWFAPVERVLVGGELTPMHDDAPRACGYLLESAYDHLAKLRRDKPVQSEFTPWDVSGGYM